MSVTKRIGRVAANMLLPALCDFPCLDTIDIHLRGPRQGLEPEDYAFHIARIPQVLRMFSANSLRTIELRFSPIEMQRLQDQFIKDIWVINNGLNEIVESSQFPLLQRIRLDLNCLVPELAGWNERLVEIFPWLMAIGMLEVVGIVHDECVLLPLRQRSHPYTRDDIHVL